MSCDAKLYFPAPDGLPIAVRPPRASAARLAALQEACLEGLVRAGALWLYGFIDEAHTIAQDDASREGS